MKNTLLIVSMLSVTAAAWAQTPPVTNPANPANQERRGGASPEQREQKREQMKQRFEAEFKKADTDGDGTLSKTEAEKGMPRLARDFDAIDANKDGKVTQDEVRARMQARMAERHGGQDGKGGPAAGGGRGPGGDAKSGDDRREQGRQRFGQQFKKADIDGDGALSKTEAEKGMPRLARDFDAIDANKDGKVTQDEIRARMQARRAERHKSKAIGKDDAPKPQ